MFKDKNERDKVQDLIDFFNNTDLTSSDIKSITFENRKKDLIKFFHLLKNINNCHEIYTKKYKLPRGEEHIWHHFLKEHDWILCLNSDIKFIRDLYPEQNIGMGDSNGGNSPIIDFVGLSEYTTLIESKHSNTKIFKQTKSKGRAQTWDFTPDFIESVSQALAQKFDFEKYFDQKNMKSNGVRIDKSKIISIDPKTVVLIGNKKHEFPLNDLEDINFIKNKTFERYRRNNRNLEILTFDELFERSYHIVFSTKLDKEWYHLEPKKLFN